MGFALSLALVTSLLVWGGCEATPEDLEKWRTTEKGKEKIMAVFNDPSYSPEMRAKAGSALTDIGEVVAMVELLKKMSPEDQGPIAEGVSMDLEKKIKAADPKEQANAKDAMYFLSDYVCEATRKKLYTIILNWAAADINERFYLGKKNLNEVFAKIGKEGVPTLVKLAGEDKSRGKATAILLDLLEKKAVDETAKAEAAAIVVAAAAKELPALKDETFVSLSKLGGPQTVEFFNNIVRDDKSPEKLRILALDGLKNIKDKSSLPLAIELAKDKKISADLRGEVIILLGLIGDDSSLPALLEWLNDTDYRWQVTQSAIKAGGAAALERILDELSKKDEYVKADVAFFEDDIKKHLKDKAIPACTKGLQSKSWVARLLAVRCLNQVGTEKEIPALQKVTGDSTKLDKSWGGKSIGALASDAIKAVKGR